MCRELGDRATHTQRRSLKAVLRCTGRSEKLARRACGSGRTRVALGIWHVDLDAGVLLPVGRKRALAGCLASASLDSRAGGTPAIGQQRHHSDESAGGGRGKRNCACLDLGRSCGGLTTLPCAAGVDEATVVAVKRIERLRHDSLTFTEPYTQAVESGAAQCVIGAPNQLRQ